MTALALFVGVVVLLCLICSPTPEPTPKQPDHGDACGKARWATPEEMEAHGLAEDATNGILVGIRWETRIVETKRWLRKPRITTERIAHRLHYVKENVGALLIAVARAGKFVSCVAPTLNWNTEDRIICFDQGQAAAVCGGSSDPKAKGWRRLLGPFVVINPWNLLPGKLLASAWVNPMHLVRLGSMTVEDDAGALASVIVRAMAQDSGPHFRNSARSLVQALILYLVLKFGRATTLSQIPDILHLSDVERNDVFLAMLESKEVDLVRYVGRRYWRAPIKKTLPDKTEISVLPPWTDEAEGVMASAREDSLFLSSSVAVNAFGGPKGPKGQPFSFDELKEQPAPGEPCRPMTVCVCSPAGDGTENDVKIFELILTTAVKSVKREPVTPRVLLMVDEFCNSTRRHSACVDLVRKLYTEGPKWGVRVLVVVQSWGQLVEHLPGGEHDANTLFGNAGVRILYGSEDRSTDSLTMDRNGARTIWGPARGAEYDFTAQGGDQGFLLATGQSAQPAPLIELQDVRAMLPNGELIAYLGGLGFPVRLHRARYFDKAVMPETAARADGDLDPFKTRSK